MTVDGHPHQVPAPFVVVATQNPVEMDGTYRLPEAQLDRFLVKLSVGYPVEAAEIEVLRGTHQRSPEQIPPVIDTGTVAQMAELAKQVYIADPSTPTSCSWPRRPATTRRSRSASARAGSSP
ncbi:hypothetical protein GCM10029992_00110 [Glycomyces albus]